MFITSLPMIVVVVVSALIFFGFLERVLERMRLTRIESIIILWSMLVASFLPNIPIYRGLQINIGGALIPLGIVVYLLWRADSHLERVRGLATILVVTVAVYTIDKFLPLEPGFLAFDIDPLYLPAFIAAAFAYITGRSRRSSFIGAVGGVVMLDILAWSENLIFYPGVIPIYLGGAGVLGSAVLAGVLAVFIAEIVGEIRERLVRGPV